MDDLSEREIDEGLAEEQFRAGMHADTEHEVQKSANNKSVDEINSDLQIAADADKKDNK